MSGMGFGGMDHMFAKEERAMEAGREQGRREMLWTVAIAACWDSWRAIDRYHPDVVYVLSDVGKSALSALADMGDQDAAGMLR